MQIHELNSFVGTPSATDYLAIDDGTETNKVPATSLGVSTQMTQAEAEAGTVTDPRVVSPSVFKISVESLAETVAETREVLVVTVASFSSLPQTVTNANITSDMVVVNSTLGTPSAQTSDWTVTASNGSLAIDGSISGSTSVELYLMKSRSGNGTTTSIIKKVDNLETYSVATGCIANRRGHIVTVTFENIKPSSTSQRTNLGTLPEGWRPPNAAYGWNVTGAGYCDINSDGTAQVFGGSGKDNVLGTITYVATH